MFGVLLGCWDCMVYVGDVLIVFCLGCFVIGFVLDCLVYGFVFFCCYIFLGIMDYILGGMMVCIVDF